MAIVTKERAKTWWIEWRMFLLFVLILFSFRSTIADWSHVPTGSMKPTLMEGDRILVDKLAYDLRFPFMHWRLSTWSDPKAGDIVIFPSPETEELYVKRVVGVPGDTIAMADNRLIVNGQPLTYFKDVQEIASVLNTSDQKEFVVHLEQRDEKKYSIMTSRHIRTPVSYFQTVEVPKGQYLVLGDNRDNSKDSRYIGFIERDRIRGKATRVILSLDSENYWLPRSGRYLEKLN